MKFQAVIKCLGIRANDEGMTQSQILLYVIYHIFILLDTYIYSFGSTSWPSVCL